MKLRRGTAEQELQALEEQRIQLASDVERAEAELEQAAADATAATRLAAAVHLDGGDLTSASKARQAAEARRAVAAGALEVLQEAIAEQDRRLEAKRAEVHAEQLEQRDNAYRDARKRINRTGGELNDVFERALVLKAKLDTDRARADACLEAARELADDRFYRPNCDDEDEPERAAGLETLVEEINSGPRRPLAKAQRDQLESARQRGVRQRSHAELLVEQAGLYPPGPLRDRRLAELDEPLRTQTLERIDARRAELQAGQDRVHAERIFDRIV
jgi:hypothetical protein